jgi:hypothetical protein
VDLGMQPEVNGASHPLQRMCLPFQSALEQFFAFATPFQ